MNLRFAANLSTLEKFKMRLIKKFKRKFILDII